MPLAAFAPSLAAVYGAAFFISARLRLREPVRALGPFGLSRQVNVTDLRLDEPKRFEAALTK